MSDTTTNVILHPPYSVLHTEYICTQQQYGVLRSNSNSMLVLDCPYFNDVAREEVEIKVKSRSYPSPCMAKNARHTSGSSSQHFAIHHEHGAEQRYVHNACERLAR